MTSTTCAALSAATATLTGPSTLSIANATTANFVQRSGASLALDNASFYAVGPNVYWLGLDENVVPNPSYPSHSRVMEICATAAAMGATTIRSTTLGVSVGCPKCLMPTLGTFNQDALDAIDYAVYAASLYGLKLIIPLTDQYDYYHGGIPSFLRFRSLSTSDHAPFYDLNSDVYKDFVDYVSGLLNHQSNITRIALRQDPTVMAWETGNELSSPPVEWTDAISTVIKGLAPNQLVVDGSYGVSKKALHLANVDIYSNHYYPVWNRKLSGDLDSMRHSDKAYIIGEFDWTVKYTRMGLLLGLIPVVIAIIILICPARWINHRISLDCFQRRSNRKKNQQRSGALELRDESLLPSASPHSYDLSENKSPTTSGDMPVPTTPLEPWTPPRRPRRRFMLRKWHIILFLLLWVPIIEGLVLIYGPSSLSQFLGKIRKSDQVAGDFYWSLFGRDDACCNFVKHHDGFTLWYGTTKSDMQGRVLQLAKHAYEKTSKVAFFASSLEKKDQLPLIACPQTN